MPITIARHRSLLGTLALVAVTGCGSSGGAGAQGDAAAVDGTVAEGGKTGDARAKDAAVKRGDSGEACTSATCDGGVCVGSPAVCCPVASTCGASCCAGSSVCLFDRCVVPGAACRSAADCGSGQYCDPSLGPSTADGGAPGPSRDAGKADGGLTDAGKATDGGKVCTDPPPPLGRCVPTPPTCPGDAGPPDGGDCVASCQYHPPTGKLDAVVKWSWGPTATAFPDSTDVWSTPTVGRLYDTNCDGKIDSSDSPSIVFVSGNTSQNYCSATADGCKHGVLRMLDGRTGKEIWSLDKASPTSMGFDGNSIALGDVDGDGRIDIVAMTGEGHLVLIDGDGTVKRTSTTVVAGSTASGFAWGGGLAIADLNRDGFPEIFYGADVFTTTGGGITPLWVGANGTGGGATMELSTAVDLDGAANGFLEVLAGNTAYKADGTELWHSSLADGFSGVGDFDGDGKPEAVLVANGSVWILNGATGAIVMGPFALPGTGTGGPPTVADFDGDGRPEIGVAMATFYSVVKPNYATMKLDLLWKTPNHDLSSSVTGSTVFDFSGAGKASVVYGDECFLWVFDGPTGSVQFSAPHMSFTATEASIVADVDGDGHSEIVMISNGASPTGWGCLAADGTPTTVNGVTWVPGPAAGKAYRGITVFGDSASSWVGTRTLWNEHTYHVTNICDDRDQACAAPNTYGSIPNGETSNWTVPWLNDFRQNVQGAGIFDAPDAVVALAVDCTTPVVAHVSVRNIGQSGLPAGVNAAVFAKRSPTDVQVGTTTTTIPLLPSQTQELPVTLAAGATDSDAFYAKIVVDPTHPGFHECRTDNDQSATVSPVCQSGPK